MGKAISAAFVMFGLPAVVFIGGAWLMLALSHRQEVEGIKPLNQRLCGYRLKDVRQLWEALSDKGRCAEKKFIELDLVFPFLYGAALATGLLLAWAALGRPFHPAWVVGPVAITLLADWMENLVQHGQLKRFIDHGGSALQAGPIQVASAATIVKLLFFYGSWAILLILVVLVLARAGRAA